ncbi:hypothetical protein P3L10_007918 [Capsicum annuum]
MANVEVSNAITVLKAYISDATLYTNKLFPQKIAVRGLTLKLLRRCPSNWDNLKLHLQNN